MKRQTWILIILMVMAVVSLWFNPVKAEDGFKPVSEWRIEEATGLFRSFGDSTPRLGTGACYGPMFEYRRWDRWMGDVISFCGYGIGKIADNDEEDERDSTATTGLQLFNLMGFRGSISYDPFGNDWYWGVQLSVSGLAEQLSR